MQTPETSVIISSCALVVSAISLIVSSSLYKVHKTNQIERRHSEIIQLKKQLFSAVSNYRQRLVSVLSNYELLRNEYRQLPDCDEKFERIENLPVQINLTIGLKEKAEMVLGKLSRIDSMKMNRSDVLLTLQSVDEDVEYLTHEVQNIEDDVLAMITENRGFHQIKIDVTAIETIEESSKTNGQCKALESAISGETTCR
ncbi:MAG: hypothetical protein WCH57_06210 [Verrucomicrobiota bacterium]